MDRIAGGNRLTAGKLAALASSASHRYYACMNSTFSRERLGITWFVSRHPGAIEWAQRRGLAIERWVAHLDPTEVEADDVVIGTLPVNLAADVCKRGARYLHLSVAMPSSWRGRELSVEELLTSCAELKAFHVDETR